MYFCSYVPFMWIELDMNLPNNVIDILKWAIIYPLYFLRFFFKFLMLFGAAAIMCGTIIFYLRNKSKVLPESETIAIEDTQLVALMPANKQGNEDDLDKQSNVSSVD